MDAETRAAQEEVIQSTEAEIKGYIVTAWIYLSGAVLLAAIGTSTYELHRTSNPTGWVSLVVEVPIALFMLGTSLMAWRFAARRQRLLGQLKKIMAQEIEDGQPWVWPPPPNVPKE